MTTGADDAGATLLCMVNPTNPTGDYLTVEAAKAYIEGAVQPGETEELEGTESGERGSFSYLTCLTNERQGRR